MSSFLTMDSVIQCPHGAKVAAVPGNTQAKAGGALVLRASDTFTVAGCPFSQNPCATVEWPGASGKTSVAHDRALRMDDTGVCKSGTGAPAGPPVVSFTQSKASGG